MKHVFLLPLLLAATIAPAADAFDAHCADIRLMQDKRIQQELKITDAQRSKMNGYAKAFTDRANAILKKQKTPPTAPIPEITEMGNRMKGQVIAVLTAAQLRRLREISLQAANAMAVADPKVAERVGVSGSQLQKYRQAIADGQRRAVAVQKAVLEPIVNKYRNRKPKNEAETQKLQQAFSKEARAASAKVQPEIARLSKETSAKLKSILTAKQLAAFEALKGKPFRA